MNKVDIVNAILKDKIIKLPVKETASAFAPTNIALCKYWGKRNQELNLPMTPSLSISLGNKGAQVELTINTQPQDYVVLNDEVVDVHSAFYKKLRAYLNLFREEMFFDIRIKSNIAIAAGLASSASGFASIILALNELFQWELNPKELSILARLGSGSASRSIISGFVEWHVGNQEDGMDCYAEKIPVTWDELCIGLILVSEKTKSLSSREAMQRTLVSSPFYEMWPKKVSHDLALLKHAIHFKDFELLGKTAESNAMTMHATMLSTWPPIVYSLPETIAAMQKIWQLREEGLPLYFTQDAGPNLKLLFLRKNIDEIKNQFPYIEIINPF